MIIKPNNMSRRGFLQGVLGIATTVILPAPRSSLEALGIDWRVEAQRIIDENQRLDGLIAGVNEFTRARLREDGFFRRILSSPPAIINDLLDRSVPTTPLPGRMINGVWHVDARSVKPKFELEDVRI